MMRFQVGSVAGPTGAGKTTIVSRCETVSQRYIERFEQNKFLEKWGDQSFDAAANQHWFLRQVKKFLADSCSRKSVILDQDPAAIVWVYSKCFLEKGLLGKRDFEKLVRASEEVESLLEEWALPRRIFLLDAPARVLYERVYQRDGAERRVPPIEWFEAIREYFGEFGARDERCVTVSTDGVSVEATVQLVQGWFQ